MRPKDARTVGGGERRLRLGSCVSLPPGLEQEQKPRRRLPQQRPRVGPAIAQHLRGGLVDEAHAILGIHHQNALAQVLHDVLRELRKIGKIHLLAAHQRLALAQAGGDRPCGKADGEEHDANDPGGGEVARRRNSGDIHEHLLQQNAERGHRGDEKGVAVFCQYGHRRHRQHEQDAKTAGNATAGIKNERYSGRIHAAVKKRHAAHARPWQAPHGHQQHARREIGDAGRQERPGTACEKRILGAGEPLHRQEHGRQEQAIQIDEADDAPGKITSGKWGERGLGRHGGVSD